MPFIFASAFYLQQYHLRQTAYERLKNEQLVCLTFTQNQASEIEAGSEIEVDGRMMDVQSISHQQNKVLVYGFYDNQEDDLNDKLTTLMNRQSSGESGNNLIEKVLQLFMMPYTYEPVVQLQPFTFNISPLYILFTVNIPTIYLPVSTLPPLCT
jgi:hypothetical protein